MTSRIRFVVETVEDCGKTVHGSFTGLINSMASLSRRCRAFRTVARHPHRHTVDHGTLVAGSQVPGLSPTFSGKRPLLQNFPSRKERKVVSFLEGKLSPTNAKDEKRRGKVGAQVVKSRDEVEDQVLKSRKEVEDEARAPSGIQFLATCPDTLGGPTIPPVRWSTRRYCYGHPATRSFYAETQPSNDSPIWMLINRAVAASSESRATWWPRRRSLNPASPLKMSPSKGRLNRVQDENCCPARVVRQVRLTSRLSTFGRSSPRTNTSVSTKLNALTCSRSYL